MDVDWNKELAEQLDWHWQNQLRPRLTGLTDEEYFWEPAAGCWSIRRRGTSTAPRAVGGGEFLFDYGHPPPDPPPVTTIAWRLAHLIVDVLGARNAMFFGGPPVEWETYSYSGTATGALDQFDSAYAFWSENVRGLGTDGLAQPCGPASGPYADYPIAALVLHNNREMLHHGAEIALLRDLYRAQ